MNKQNTITQELSQVKPYINLMVKHLDDVIKDTESGVMDIIDAINTLVTISRHQAESINKIKREGFSLDEVSSIDANNKEMLLRFSEMFDFLQFHDIIRQRLTQVEHSLHELDHYWVGLSRHLNDPSWDGVLETSIADKLDKLRQGYVMESQRLAHNAVLGEGTLEADNNRPSIELF